MRTKLLVYSLAALLLVGGALADDTDDLAANEGHEADGVWYAVYSNYVSMRTAQRISPDARRQFPGLIGANRQHEPIFYVLTLEVRGEEVTGTMTTGRGVRIEDPQESMKRLLGLPLAPPSTPPPSRVLQGSVEGEQVLLTALAGAGDDEAVAITAEIDADSMRATVHLPNTEARIVRLDRCRRDAATADSDSDAASAADPAAYCTVDAIWQRLSEEHGLPVAPSQSAPARR